VGFYAAKATSTEEYRHITLTGNSTAPFATPDTSQKRQPTIKIKDKSVDATDNQKPMWNCKQCGKQNFPFMKDGITERTDCYFYWKNETYGGKKAKTKTNNAGQPKKDTGSIAMDAVSDQVTDLIKKALTQQREELSKKFSHLEQKMNVCDSGVSNHGAIGIEGQRMTGNDFMLSVMETYKSQVSVPTCIETEKPPFIDHVGDYDEGSRCGLNGNEIFLTGMEYFTSAQYVIITHHSCLLSCIPMSLHGPYSCLTHVISTACNFAEAHKSWTTALIIIALAAYLVGQVQACPNSRSPPFSQMHSAKNRHDVYCFQTSAGLVHNRLFLDSDESRTIIHDAGLLSNIRPLQRTRTVQGLTGAQSINYQGDLHLNMTNTTGKQCSFIIKDVYYNPALSYNLVNVSDLTNHDYTSSFSRHGATLQGPAGMFDLIKSSKVYLFPVNPKDDQGLGAFSGLMEEERMHYRLNHVVNPQKMVILSKSGAKGIKPDMRETKFKCNIFQRANIVRQDAPPATTDSNPHDIAFDLVDMTKVKTISGCQYCTIVIRRETRFMWTFVHRSKDALSQILDRVLNTLPQEQKNILKSDCAPEYYTQTLEDMFRTKHGVTEIRHSNEHQQFQNTLVEKCVDSLGKMISVMLLQSQLPPEFWGCSVMLSTDLANCRPHDSLEGCTPFYRQYGILLDYSFFLPFGCQMVIHRGACLVEHGTLAPRGENTV
jgi:hypothetical protein